MLRKNPTFAAGCHLARYIDPEYRRSPKKPPKPGAYQRKLDETFLSVNSTEVETVSQIAQIYADKFEQGNRPVGIALPTVAKYNLVAQAVGVILTYNGAKQVWEFGASRVAYRHRPSANNNSHCGVEYTESLADFYDFRFALRMAKAATCKLV